MLYILPAELCKLNYCYCYYYYYYYYYYYCITTTFDFCFMATLKAKIQSHR